MNTKLLVDAIVRQTTVFIAELCTAAGVRAPLAYIADEVFVGLARQLEEQGVGRKVAADMFGLALRGYQKKVQRLTKCETQGDKTLWQAVVEFLLAEGSATRYRIFERFRNDSEDAVAAILSDLVANGLVYSTGTGHSTLYGPTTAADRTQLAQQDIADSVPEMVCLLVCRQGPIAVVAIAKQLRLDAAVVNHAVERLRSEGRLEMDEQSGALTSAQLHIAVGAKQGWETAVFDHYQSMVKAVAGKLRRGPMSAHEDVVGGATLSFDLCEGHPLEPEVLALLKETRTRIDDLWQRVEWVNAKTPIASRDKVVVTFYMGQNVEGPFGEDSDIPSNGRRKS